MPEASLNISISAEDLARLRDLPQQIESLAESARQALDAIRTGVDSGNPVGALIGGLETLVEEAGQLPAVESIVAPLQELVGQLPEQALGDVASVGRDVDQVMGLFGPLREILLSGNLEQAVEKQKDKILDLAESLGQESAELGQLGGELQEFVRLFGQVGRWKESPPEPEEVAQLLSRLLLGLPLDMLGDAESVLDSALEPFEKFLQGDPDLTAWRAVNQRLSAMWRELGARFADGSEVDWGSILAELQEANALVLELTVVRDRLASTALFHLNRAGFAEFSAVAQAVEAIVPIRPFKLNPIIEGLRLQLRGMVEELDGWTPTEDQLRQVVRGFVDQVLAYIDRTPLGELRVFMVNFQQTLLQTVESLPLRGLANTAEAELLKIADAVDVIDPEAVRRPIHDFFDDLRGRIEEIPVDDIRDATGGIWTTVETTLNQIVALIDEVRGTLEGVVGEVQAFVEQAGPTLQQITDQVAVIRAQIEGFSLDEPADLVIEELNGLRDTVRDLDLSSLPEAAVGALKIGAEILRGIDLTATVQAPLDKALARIDPTPLLEEAADSLSGITAQLQLLNPEHVAGRLDAPVEEIIGAIHQFGPEQFRRLVEEALEPMKEAVRSFDFGQLIAPLSRLYAELIARVESILDPELIFQPLEELYQPILDVVDALDPVKLAELLEPHAGGVTEGFGPLAGPPQALKEAGGALRSELSEETEGSDPLFGYRPGDLLTPLVDLHRKLIDSVENLPVSVLGPAAKSLGESLQGRFQKLAPRSIENRVALAMNGVRLDFDPANISARLEEAGLAYRRTVELIGRAAGGELSELNRPIASQVLTLLPDVDPLQLVPDASQGESVFSATVRVESGIELDDLRAGFGSLEGWLGQILQTFPPSGALGGDLLLQALRDLDPAPLRDEINDLFDQFGQRLVGFSEVLLAALEPD